MISLIVAMSQNKVIGSNNAMPWHIPGELARFKRITTGHAIIMGRKTFESIGRVLPNRTNIIITRDSEYKVEGALIVNSLDEALRQAKEADGSEELFIIGGGEIFKQAMPIADKLYLTLVHKDVDGDTYFPDYSMFTKQISREDHEHDGFSYSFLELVKE